MAGATDNPQGAEQTAKPIRKRKPRSKGFLAIDADTGLPIGSTPEKDRARDLEALIPEVVSNLRSYITKSKNEAAALTACTRVIESSDDPGTPEAMRSALRELWEEAKDRLTELASSANKEAVGAQANAALIKAMRGAVTSDWPDKRLETPEGKARMQRARELSACPPLI